MFELNGGGVLVNCILTQSRSEGSAVCVVVAIVLRLHMGVFRESGGISNITLFKLSKVECCIKNNFSDMKYIKTVSLINSVELSLFNQTDKLRGFFNTSFVFCIFKVPTLQRKHFSEFVTKGEIFN